MKILVSAYACDPRVGSEPGIGWRWVREIARRHDCWVITRENNVELIEERARAEGLTRLRVHGFDLPRWARWWKRGGRGAVAYFYLWQLGLVPLARRLDRAVDFDVTHHLTFSSSWIHSGLAWIGKPFVWGPIGRHPRIPTRFLREGDVRARAKESVKALVRRSLSRWDPLLSKTVRSADRILSLGREATGGLPEAHRSRASTLLACGADLVPLSHDRWVRAGTFEVLFAGRLVDLKGCRLALQAFGHFAAGRPDARLRFAGRGPEEGRLRALALALGLAERVEFLGQLEHAEVLERMGNADAFLFPSIEGGGMVVVEALARGCPVVCLDFGGPGEMVGPDRGLRVELSHDVGSTARGLALALGRLYDDDVLRRALGAGARSWAERHASWNAKGERLTSIYTAALGRRGAAA